MTLSAVYRLVLALQGEICQVVVESFGLYLCEGLFIVTVNTLQSKPTLVYVFMAAIAVVRLYPQSILKKLSGREAHIVTLGTVDLLVCSAQRKISFIVIKTAEGCQGGKRLLIMALLAIGAQLAVVRILVTTVAVGKGDTGKYLKLLAISRFFLMTVYTAYIRMLAK